MSLPNLLLEYVVRYGFQVVGASVILIGGAFAARQYLYSLPPA